MVHVTIVGLITAHSLFDFGLFVCIYVGLYTLLPFRRVYCLKDYPRKLLATKVIVSPQDLGGKHLAGRPYAQSTDLWSLGVVLYELLLGALSGVEIRTWKGHFLQTFRNILGGIKHMLANVG